MNQELSGILKEAYKHGAETASGGGALGTLAAVPLVKNIGKPGSIILSLGTSFVLFVITFGIDITTIISDYVEKLKETQRENMEEILEQRQRREARRDGKRSKKEEQKKKGKYEKEEIEELEDIEQEQIQINLNGRIIDENNGKKKYKYEDDDLVPLGIKKKASSKQVAQPNVIENNLFKQEEEKKEDKTKQVLQLEHAMVAHEEDYEYPP